MMINTTEGVLEVVIRLVVFIADGGVRIRQVMDLRATIPSLAVVLTDFVVRVAHVMD